MSSEIILGVSRALLVNTADYVEYIEASTQSYDAHAYDDAAWDLLKHFYELAAFQMPDAVIDRRLFPDGDTTQPATVLRAMEEVLASWQRGGIVTSQQEPLREFTLWLLEAQRAIANEVEDSDLRCRIERGVNMAEKRLV